MSDTPLTEKNLRWYQGLDRYCWVVLIIAALGWLFDTMDQNLYNLVRKPSLTALIAPTIGEDRVKPADRDAVRAKATEAYLKEQKKEALDPVADAKGVEKAVTQAAVKRVVDQQVKQKGGWINAIFLIGWAIGGFVFGVLGDRMGRAKTMVVTILIYAVFTGLSGLAPNWEIYATARFITALGVGGEWAAGASLVAEVFPQRSRAMALGSLQALSAVGNMMAAVITLILGNLDKNWHWAYYVGTIPALMVFWILKSVKEPEAWYEARKKASFGKEMGAISELFTNRLLRRNTLTSILLATAGVGGLWGIGFFSTDMINGEMTNAGYLPASIGRLTSIMFFVQMIGAFLGIYAFAMISERLTRRAAFTIWFALAWGSILLFFWGLQGSGDQAFWRGMALAPILGFCTLGPFSGFTVYFPELFPTRLRTTGCGVGYNAARIFAAPFAVMLGSLAAFYGGGSRGFAMAASTVSCVYILGFIGVLIGPETKGRALPEDNAFEEGGSGIGEIKSGHERREAAVLH